jgi:mRNA-degrading endonuclease RelE of RelBE toxin-antitoxin system
MQVFLHKAAEKYLERLSEPNKSRIKSALKGLEKEPQEGDIRPYEGNPGIRRLKVSGYRALYKIEDDTILVTHIEPRGQAYTKKTRKKRG